MNLRAGSVGPWLLGCALALAAGQAAADSGFYAGGSIGSATIQADFPDGNDADRFELDDDDFAWKGFVGYNAELALFDLGIEAGYVDLGSPSGGGIDLDVDGWDAFGLAGVDVGPFGVFAKAGIISWDTEVSGGGVDFGDDGTDPAYGVGARLMLGSLEVRAEYEYFDLDAVDDAYLVSAGLVWTF